MSSSKYDMSHRVIVTCSFSKVTVNNSQKHCADVILVLYDIIKRKNDRF